MRDRLRVMLWCSTCVNGVQQPLFAAAAAGRFADHGLDVEFVNLPTAPNSTLRGLSQRVDAVAREEVDCAVTSVAYQLAAQAAAQGALPARFVAAFHQRNPIAGLVRADSCLREPEQLAIATTARWSMNWFVREYVAALGGRGLGSGPLVDTPNDAYAGSALATGTVDVVPTWVDTVPIVTRTAGLPVRAIPLDFAVYATGLVARDSLPADVVWRLRQAVVAGFELQRAEPQMGADAFCQRFPKVPESDVTASWTLFEPFGFDSAEPCAMDDERWLRTIEYTAAVHRLAPPAPDQVYRPELAAAKV